MLAPRPLRTIGSPRRDARATIQRLKRIVDIAGSHHLYAMRCLQRSLVLRQLLSRNGIDTELRIGVRRDASRAELMAHAWLEFRGQRVGEDESGAAHFAPLTAVDPRASACGQGPVGRIEG
jgi:hypothetical protein